MSDNDNETSKRCLTWLAEHNYVVFVLQANHGCGKVFINHKEVKGLQGVQIKTHTDDESINFAEIGIQVDPKHFNAKRGVC